MQQIMDDPQKKTLIQQMYFHGRGQGKYGDPKDHLIVMADDPIIVDDMGLAKSTGETTAASGATDAATTAGGCESGCDGAATTAADGAATEAGATTEAGGDGGMAPHPDQA